MNTIEQNISRIIEKEIFVNASTFVADMQATELCDRLPNTFEKLIECSVKDDWREPVIEAVQDITPAGLFDLCEYMVIDLYTKDGRIVTDTLAETIDHDNVDRSPVIKAIEDGDQWQDVGEYLSLDPFTVEALQHWLVSDWLAEKLERVGALIAVDVMGFNIWGRTECGQSLEYDSTLKAVAKLIESDLNDVMGRD
ncbi:hypothetical protein [Marinobacter nauticus]|uniref:Uncharacterized protein n=1 Tax=Marinobacter nauticus TaxID=2743 RepID=A0A833N8Y8_MARNT|nr:hypothetical protein [Marinobacter nauticus]KAE8546186.1 hypothetical protein F6453_1432 [Marinobacter nauticus]